MNLAKIDVKNLVDMYTERRYGKPPSGCLITGSFISLNLILFEVLFLPDQLLRIRNELL